MSGAHEVIRKAASEGRTLLTLEGSRKVLEDVGVPLTRMSIARNAAEAGDLAALIGFPVALKVSSPDVVHKSDVGGVILDVRDEFAAMEAYGSIVRSVEEHSPGAMIEGVVIDEMVRGPELIIGLIMDPQFGPLVMFGIGGIMVEVYRDVTFRLVPLERSDALAMMDEVKGQGILNGARGRPTASRSGLADIILSVASIFERFPQVVQVDINPLVLTGDGPRGVDARVVIGQ